MSKKATKRGEGRLYKRDKAGKEHPANSKVPGVFYLEFRVDGKRTRQRLTDAKGKAITEQDVAKKRQEAILSPFRDDDKVEQLRVIQSKLQTIEERKAEELEARVPALKLSAAWAEYLKSHNRPKSGVRTLEGYSGQFTLFNKWMKKNFPKVEDMRDVTTQHAEGYADHLEGRSLSPSTFNQHLKTLTLIWAVLFKKAKLTENPFAWDKKTKTGIQRKSIKAESLQRKKRPLTLDETNALIEEADGDYRSLLIMLACTGQRLIDCVKMRWSNVDFKKGIITIIPRKTAKRTGKQVYIPILPQLRAELESIHRRDKYILPELVEEYDRDAGSALTKHIRTIFDDAGITAAKETDLQTKRVILDTGAHSLRHSFVLIARLSGLPDALIMKITGHKSEELVDHYTEFTESLVVSLASRIPQNQPAGQKFLEEPKPAARIVPDWIAEKLEHMTSQNWEQIKTEIMEARA